MYILYMFSFTNARERRPMIQSRLPPWEATAQPLLCTGCLSPVRCSSHTDPTQTHLLHQRYRLVQPVLGLPPRQIQCRILGPLLGLVHAKRPGHVLGHKRRELDGFGLSALVPLSIRLSIPPPRPQSCTHLEPVQRRADVGPHLVPLDDEATALGVPTHGPRARALVEALVDILGREAQSAVAQRLEHSGGLHRGVGSIRMGGGGGGGCRGW